MLTASERRRPPMAHAYGLWLSFEANTFGEATNEIICGLSRASSSSHAHHSRIAEPKSILLLTTAKLHVLFLHMRSPSPGASEPRAHPLQHRPCTKIVTPAPKPFPSPCPLPSVSTISPLFTSLVCPTSPSDRR